MARGRKTFGKILERSGKGETGSPGLFYYWKGERPLSADAPQMHGTGEIRLESADRASGYFTTQLDSAPDFNARTAGIYVRADAEHIRILDSGNDQQRASLLADRLRDWRGVMSA